MNYKSGDLYLCKRYTLLDISVQTALESRWSHCGIIVIKNNEPYVLDISPERPISLLRLVDYQRNPKISESCYRPLTRPTDIQSGYLFERKVSEALGILTNVTYESNIDIALRTMLGKNNDYERTGHVSHEFITYFLSLIGIKVSNITIKDLQYGINSHIDRIYDKERSLGVLQTNESKSETIRNIMQDSETIGANLISNYMKRYPRLT